MSAEAKTPETDAAARNRGHFCLPDMVVPKGVSCRLERERDEARRERDALLEAHARHACSGESLADTLKRLRDAAETACDERDKLRKVADELHWLALLADYDSERRDSALLGYRELPHVLARKERGA